MGGCTNLYKRKAMTLVNWREILGWTDEQLDELRFAGFSFVREGHYQKALLFFKALVLLDPESAYDIQTLGAIYLEIGEPEKALLALTKAIQLDPIDEPSRLNKAKALIATHQKTEALELIHQLQRSTNQTIADDASALIHAWT
ncbi:MAG: hypothetical protein S4CHLAM123_13610 [Chlamydiales bacterium]|nr:hypothetical protein [Chlamydiales bacterium]